MGSKRFFAAIAALGMVFLLLASCAPAAAPPAAPKAAPVATPKPAAEQPKSGGILKHAGFQDEPTYDLQTTGRSLAFDQVGPAYSGLLQYDPADGRKIITDLAESYQVSPDGKKVTFVLRKNIKWHDDKPFTAEDVKFNFDRWMKPPEGVVIARKAVIEGVERVEAPNANTVKVYLKYPRPAFIPVLASIAGVLLPPQYLKDNKKMEFNVLGTGPFKLKEYKRGVSVELVKNKDYFLPGRPYLDGITTYLMPDATARFAALRTGQVRTMYVTSGNISTANVETLRKEMSDKFNVAKFPGLVIGLVHLGVKQPPFNDLRVRQAMDMVVDRKKVLDVMEGQGEITGPMVRGPWAIPDDELLKRPGFRGVTPADIEKAKALLAEAGYPKGFQTEATIIAGYNKQTVFLQDQLKAIGIDVAIKVGDTATVERRQFAHDFAINVILQGEPVDEPDLFLSYYLTGGGRNYGGTSDKQIDDWYAEQSKMMDPVEIGDLVDSEIMQLYPFSFARELYLKFSDTVDEPILTNTQNSQVSNQQPAPAMQQQAQPQYQQPMMQQPMMQQPMMQQPMQGMYNGMNPMAPGMYQNPMQMPYPVQDVSVAQAQFQPFSPTVNPLSQQENIDLIMDVPLEVTVELGRTNKSIKEILEFAPGTIIELNKLAGEPIDVLVNGKFVAKGEVVVIEESFGIRVTDIIK